MGDIVWSLDSGRDEVGDLASRLRAFGSDLLESRGVDWSVEAPAEAVHQSLSPAMKRQLYLVFREGIHNVAKHSAATRATLCFKLQEGAISGELTDNGRGAVDGSGKGNGIRSMRQRVGQLDGKFEITTPAAGGTTIRIHVPL